MFVRNHIVMFELAIQRGLADTKNLGRGHFIVIGFAQGAENGAALQFFERKDFVFCGQLIHGGVVQAGRQLSDVNQRAGADRHSASDGILEFADVARPVVSH